MSRPARVRIDLDALRHNYVEARRFHGGQAVAVVKADAFGHGAVRCAQALEGLADALGVAFLGEALALREAGVGAPILVLEGAFSAGELELAAQRGCWLVVHHEAQIRMIERAPIGCSRLNVWLKIDTGMHRAGISPADVRSFHRRLRDSGRVSSITLMSHFARADEPGCDFTETQIARFDAATAGLPGPRSLANSAGVIAWPAARRDWARPGMMLYGVDPTGAADPRLELAPVMTLESEVFAERHLAAGESVGYGGGFVAERPLRVGLVAMGYGDGYPGRAPTGTPVEVDGTLTRLVGRVSMDMLAVDLTDLPSAGCGSRVELWGRRIAVAEVARRAGMLSYELLCNVKRAPRCYAEAALAYADTGT